MAESAASSAAGAQSVPDGGYLAVPPGSGPWPGLVMIFEAFGLDDEMRRHADRLAGLGYLTLMPDLYHGRPAWRCVAATMRSLRSGTGPVFDDLAAARTALAGRADCTGRVGVIGFCMGGAFALLVAPRGFEVAVVNYGPLPRDLDAAVAGSCPVVASYGGRDPGLRGAAARLTTAYQRAGVTHDVREYPAAGHSFLNERPNGPALMRLPMALSHTGPEPASAAEAWPRIEAFLARHLGSPE